MKLEEILIPKVQEAVKTLYGVEITPAQVQFQKTRAEFEGDITLVVFPFVKAARKAPAMVAQEVGEALVGRNRQNHYHIQKVVSWWMFDITRTKRNVSKSYIGVRIPNNLKSNMNHPSLIFGF